MMTIRLHAFPPVNCSFVNVFCVLAHFISRVYIYNNTQRSFSIIYSYSKHKLIMISWRAIHESSHASLCVNIACANSYVACVTLFRKLSYVRKIVNSCVNIRTIAAVARQKSSVKIASGWSYPHLPRCFVLESQHKFVYGDAWKITSLFTSNNEVKYSIYNCS